MQRLAAFIDRVGDRLSEADEVIVAGEALSHCVANTVLGFEQLGADFVAEMQARGMKTARSKDFML